MKAQLWRNNNKRKQVGVIVTGANKSNAADGICLLQARREHLVHSVVYTFEVNGISKPKVLIAFNAKIITVFYNAVYQHLFL